jgi:hypothetical protein
MARALRWCFETNFHTDGLESEKLHDLWHSLAQDGKVVHLTITQVLTITGGLKLVREQDMLSTIHKIANTHFREYELPALAERQMNIFMDEFSDYISFNDDVRRERMVKWLERVMEHKCDILVTSLHNKIVFPSPGAPYDPQLMSGETEDNQIVKKSKRYRVKVCVAPAIYMSVKEPEWPDASAIEIRPENYKEALLESRNFFSNEPGKYTGWEGSWMTHSATVIIEKIPDETQPTVVTAEATTANANEARGTLAGRDEAPTRPGAHPNGASAITHDVFTDSAKKSTSQGAGKSKVLSETPNVETGHTTESTTRPHSPGAATQRAATSSPNHPHMRNGIVHEQTALTISKAGTANPTPPSLHPNSSGTTPRRPVPESKPPSLGKSKVVKLKTKSRGPIPPISDHYMVLPARASRNKPTARYTESSPEQSGSEYHFEGKEPSASDRSGSEYHFEGKYQPALKDKTGAGVKKPTRKGKEARREKDKKGKGNGKGKQPVTVFETEDEDDDEL